MRRVNTADVLFGLVVIIGEGLVFYKLWVGED